MLLNGLIIIVFIISTLVILILTTSLRSGIVPMPSSPSERRMVLKILADYGNIRTVYDFGAGWGGLSRKLARRLPARKIIAVEQSLVPHFVSRIISFFAGQKAVSHLQTDLCEVKLKDNEAFITYLSGPAMKELRKSFERDQPTKGVLVSIAFAMPGWTPARVEQADGLFNTRVYVYEF